MFLLRCNLEPSKKPIFIKHRFYWLSYMLLKEQIELFNLETDDYEIRFILIIKNESQSFLNYITRLKFWTNLL